jgi:Fe-S cluster assembly protein SufD
MKHTLHILEAGNTQEKFVIDDSNIHVFFLHNYSGKVHVEIQKEGAQAYIFGMYVGKSNDNIKIMTVQDHQKGNSMSDLFVRGVFFDQSKFLFEGLINIAKDAQQSNAYQKNQNLLLSKEAYVDSRPFLEIQANDVRCTHGSTTGRIDKEQLQYIMARGIDKKQAEQLVIKGFIEEIFLRMKEVAQDIDIDTLRKKVVEYDDVING